jgi:transposase
MTTIEQRQTIHRMAQQGFKCQQIAEHLDLKLSVVKKWRSRLKKGGLSQAKWVGH